MTDFVASSFGTVRVNLACNLDCALTHHAGILVKPTRMVTWDSGLTHLSRLVIWDGGLTKEAGYDFLSS